MLSQARSPSILPEGPPVRYLLLTARPVALSIPKIPLSQQAQLLHHHHHHLPHRHLRLLQQHHPHNLFKLCPLSTHSHSEMTVQSWTLEDCATEHTRPTSHLLDQPCTLPTLVGTAFGRILSTPPLVQYNWVRNTSRLVPPTDPDMSGPIRMAAWFMSCRSIPAWSMSSLWMKKQRPK